MLKKIIPVFIGLFTSNLFAQQSTNMLENNVSINLMAIPDGNSVISYERYFNRQSVWFGMEYHFNGLLKKKIKTSVLMPGIPALLSGK